MSFALQVRYDVRHKTVTPYYTSVINSTLDICGFLNGTTSNIALKFFFGQFSATAPKGLLHPCPFFGELMAYNISYNINILNAIHIPGTYMTKSHFFDDKDSNIFTLIIVGEVLEIQTRG